MSKKHNKTGGWTFPIVEKLVKFNFWVCATTFFFFSIFDMEPTWRYKKKKKINFVIKREKIVRKVEKKKKKKGPGIDVGLRTRFQHRTRGIPTGKKLNANAWTSWSDSWRRWGNVYLSAHELCANVPPFYDTLRSLLLLFFFFPRMMRVSAFSVST